MNLFKQTLASKIAGFCLMVVLAVTTFGHVAESYNPFDNGKSRATVGGVSTYASEVPGNITGGDYGYVRQPENIQDIICDSQGNIPINSIKTYVGNLVSIQVGVGSATITNNTSCNFPVSVASYRMYGNTLESQQIHDSTQVVNLAPGETRTLYIRVDACPSQIDVYYGEALTQLTTGSKYQEDKTLAWAFNFDTMGLNLKDLPGPFCGNTTTPIPCVPSGFVMSADEFQDYQRNGMITVSEITTNPTTGKASVTITNKTNKAIELSMSSYKMFDQLPILATQQFFDGTNMVTIPACGEKTLMVKVADCATQIDLWHGFHPYTLLNSNPYTYPYNPFVVTYAFYKVNNLCTKTTPPPPPPAECKMEITKKADRDFALPGETVKFTIKFKNTGTANCTGGGVHVIDRVNLGWDFAYQNQSSNVTAGYQNFPAYDATKRIANWNADVLTPGEEGWVVLGLKVAPSQAIRCGTYNTLTNTAEITAVELNGKWIKSNTTETKVSKICRGWW